MKKLTYILLASFLLIAHSSVSANALIKYSAIEDDTLKIADNANRTVYVCTGQYAYAYHSSSTCAGLNNCSGRVIAVDEYTAINTYHRIPCCRCWSNVSRCHDDNPNYKGGGASNGGGSAEGYAVLGCVIAATALVFVSNDMYIYPAMNINNLANQQDCLGVGFGLRKTFKQCAIEYGATYIGDWQIQLGFVHHYGYRKLSETWKPYLGCMGYFDGDKLGVLCNTGLMVKAADRLCFDLRYEYDIMNNHNILKLGMIFKYQKRYKWLEWF